MSILTIKKARTRLKSKKEFQKKELQRNRCAINAEVPGEGVELTRSLQFVVAWTAFPKKSCSIQTSLLR